MFAEDVNLSVFQSETMDELWSAFPGKGQIILSGTWNLAMNIAKPSGMLGDSTGTNSSPSINIRTPVDYVKAWKL